jgi:hypothetical protein
MNITKVKLVKEIQEQLHYVNEQERALAAVGVVNSVEIAEKRATLNKKLQDIMNSVCPVLGGSNGRLH